MYEIFLLITFCLSLLSTKHGGAHTLIFLTLIVIYFSNDIVSIPTVIYKTAFFFCTVLSSMLLVSDSRGND